MLLGLEDVLVLLRSEDKHTLACVSVSRKHLELAALTLDNRQHPMLMHCLQQHSLSVSNNKTQGDAEMCRLLGTRHVVALPLLTAKQVWGVMVAAVSHEQLVKLQSQTRFLQAFGLHAGTALTRHLCPAERFDAHITRIRQEQLLAQHPLKSSQPVQTGWNELADELQQAADFPEARELETIDMAHVVRELALLLQTRRFFPEHIQFQYSWPNHSSLVLGSAHMIKQILLKLFGLARENLPDGGLIGVSGGTLVEQANQCYIQFSVRDSGLDLLDPKNSHTPGLPSRYKPSPKHQSGLHAVQQLVQKMHGQIRYVSSHKGVRYEVLLPAA